LSAELVQRAEQYLRRRGAKVLYAGGIQPLGGFYLGLYGGSELPGVLASDPLARVLPELGYRTIDRVDILQRDLASFRPVISREQRMLGREARITEDSSPAPASWWSACMTSGVECTRFHVVGNADNSLLASATFWDMEPLASGWGLHAAGLLELLVEPAHRRRGIATYLIGEAFKELRTRGVSLIEAQTMRDNVAAVQLYEKLGFSQVDCGYVFRKDAER
jgi:ribosomal protein S18 acetylase RimI-like enzyme